MKDKVNAAKKRLQTLRGVLPEDHPQVRKYLEKYLTIRQKRLDALSKAREERKVLEEQEQLRARRIKAAEDAKQARKMESYKRFLGL
jgi:hypothetical protein